MSGLACKTSKITEVCRPRPIAVVSPTDFAVEPLGLIDSAQLLEDPRYSLYCFDPDTQEAVFILARDVAEVDRSPFYYHGQIEQAEQVVRMPLAEFHRLADQIALPNKGLIFIHSVGRCGSTLVSKLLQTIPRMHSLSEPDDLTQLGKFRAERTLSDETIRELLVSSVRWRCKPTAGSPAEFVAIKSRSEVLVLADLFGTSFPDARHLFLYRDAISWMRTLFRGWPIDKDVYDSERNREMETSWSRSIPLVAELRRDDAPMNAVEIRMCAWITCMEAYFMLADMPIPTRAARFEDLITDPLPIVEQILEFCGVEAPDWNAIRDVLGKDSQAGTIFGREERKNATNELTEDLIQSVRRLLASRPVVRTPDFLVPNTIQVS